MSAQTTSRAPRAHGRGRLDVGAREYDPDTGTFISPDPLLDPENPNSLNPFAYAHHNPITHSDPSGFAPEWLWGIGGSKLSDNQRAMVVVGATAVAAVAVCAATAGIGCAIMTGAAIGAGLGAAFAPEGQRSQGALIGGLAGAVGGGVGGLLGGTAGIAEISYLRLAAAGAAAGVSENATNQLVSTGTIDWRQLLAAGVLGGALGPAGKIVGKFARKLMTCRGHSFAPTTPVLMADGTAKPIENVGLGDEVAATDPETGETSAKQVEQLHLNHDTDLTNLTVQTEDTTPADGAAEDTTAVLHTTQSHPFWDRTLGEWVDAGDLVVGHRLRTSEGGTVTVTAVHNYSGGTKMYDLTVADIHTY